MPLTGTREQRNFGTVGEIKEEFGHLGTLQDTFEWRLGRGYWVPGEGDWGDAFNRSWESTQVELYMDQDMGVPW